MSVIRPTNLSKPRPLRTTIVLAVPGSDPVVLDADDLAPLTVEEADGAPSVGPIRTLVFDGATVTDDGSGQVTITITATGAPSAADYLVGTAQAGLSGEIVAGTVPGGELGGTWASPTVDPTHSGSAHVALGTSGATAAAGDHDHPGGSGTHSESLTDGNSNFIFAAGDIVTVVGVPD